MIYTLRDYYVADNKTISDDDIKDAIRIANELNETIRVTWSGPGYRYYPSEINAYHMTIMPGSNFEELKAKKPKIYGI